MHFLFYMNACMKVPLYLILFRKTEDVFFFLLHNELYQRRNQIVLCINHCTFHPICLNVFCNIIDSEKKKEEISSLELEKLSVHK